MNPITTWIPLSFVFCISAVKEGIDDYRRYKADLAANMRLVFVFRHGVREAVASQSVRVGDIVFMSANAEVPADIVVLKSSDAAGGGAACHVETSNLDGETDLKPRRVRRRGPAAVPTAGGLNRPVACVCMCVCVRAAQALPETCEQATSALYSLRGSIECAPPNAELYKFDSVLRCACRCAAAPGCCVFRGWL